jgi:hypothetical protein
MDAMVAVFLVKRIQGCVIAKSSSGEQEKYKRMNHNKDISRCNLIIIMIIVPAWFRFQVGEMSVAGYRYRGFFDH